MPSRSDLTRAEDGLYDYFMIYFNLHRSFDVFCWASWCFIWVDNCCTPQVNCPPHTGLSLRLNLASATAVSHAGSHGQLDHVDDMIKDTLWFAFIKHLWSSKRSNKDEWSMWAPAPIFHTASVFGFVISTLMTTSGTWHDADFLQWTSCHSVDLGLFLKILAPPPNSLVRDCVNMRECGGGWCVLVTQPVPCKRIHHSTNRSFLLQLQAGIQIVWGVTASYQSYYLKRTVYCVRWIRLKIVELDGSFKLIRIFQQQQLWWISRLNTDVSLHYVWEEEHHEAPDCISSNIPLVPMNIDPCTSKVKVDTTKSAEWAAVFLAHYFLVFLTI